MQSKGFFSSCLLLVALVCLLTPSLAKTRSTLYDSSKSTTLLLNRDNFDKQITKHRAKHVAVVHFHKFDDNGSESIAFEFEKFAQDWQGVFRIATIDCFAQYELCEKEGVTTLPTVRIYPILPIPPFDYEGDMSAKGWTGAASKFVQTNVFEVTDVNMNKFISENPSVPKALLFTDKPGIPVIYKALSVAFEKKIFLGIVRAESTDIYSKYNVKKNPTILVIKPHDKKTVVYDGDLKYGKIFDFMNVYTETFVPGGEKLDSTKPWTTEDFPELHKKSANDICFDHEGMLCGIYITKAPPSPAETDVVKDIMKGATDNKYKYMWLNAETQQDFAKIFKAEELPRLVILSHGKIKKFVSHEGEFSKAAIVETLEKIINGDARFQRLKGDMPSLN